MDVETFVQDVLSSDSPIEKLDHGLSSFPPRTQVDVLVQLLQLAASADDHLLTLIHHTFHCLTDNNFYLNRYSDRDTVNNLICYEEFVAPSLKRLEDADIEKQQLVSFLETKWGGTLQHILGPLCPPLPTSKRILQKLKRLSTIPRMNSDKITHLLLQHIKERHRKATERGWTGLKYYSSHITEADLDGAIIQVRSDTFNRSVASSPLPTSQLNQTSQSRFSVIINSRPRSEQYFIAETPQTNRKRQIIDLTEDDSDTDMEPTTVSLQSQ